MEKNAKIYVAGHRGLVGSAIVRKLEADGRTNLIKRTSGELDLTRQDATEDFFKTERPAYVFLAAAKVGGIGGNSTYGADFITENLEIQTNVIKCAHRYGVKKLLFLGSSCIYPRMAHQPMREDELLSGKLEPTNEPYAVAKIAGIVMCQAYRRQHGSRFISVMPTNLYGPGDNFGTETSHVLAAMIRKFHDAKTNGSDSTTLWGTGSPRREFLHVDDAAAACVYLMENYDEPEIVNIGSGEDMTIKELAETIRGVVGYEGTIEWDMTKPDGTPRKLLDVSKINALGWRAGIPLEDGIRRTYEWFLSHVD